MSRYNLRSISFDIWAIISDYGIQLRGQIVQICHHCKLASAIQLGCWHPSFSPPFSSQFTTVLGEYVLGWSHKWPWRHILKPSRMWAGKGEGQSAEVLRQRILPESPRQRWSLCPTFPWKHRRSDDSQHSHTICSGPGEWWKKLKKKGTLGPGLEPL